MYIVRPSSDEPHCFLPCQTVSLPQVITGLGKPRRYLAVDFLFPLTRRWIQPLFQLAACGTVLASELQSPATCQLRAVRVLLGESQECGWTPEREMMVGGRHPTEDHEAESKEVGLKRGRYTQRLFFISKCAIVFYILLETFQGLHLHTLDAYFFSYHVLHSYWITCQSMNCCSFVLLSLCLVH